MLRAVTKLCDRSSVRDGVCPASFSIARGGTIAPRVGPALEEPFLAVDADGLRVPEIVVPVGDHLNGLSAPLQFPRDLIRDAALERQIARPRAPGSAHQPARCLD